MQYPTSQTKQRSIICQRAGIISSLPSSNMYTLQIGPMSWFELTAGALSIFLLLFCLYNLALPKPIPGIPYNKSATKRLLGDLPDLIEYQKHTEEQCRWFALQNQKFNSPVCQVFIRPIVSDIKVNRVYFLILSQSKDH
ncbi:hypothetical protein QL093DRAFT_2400323 [Fusarium oxysporum]|nr:hypothetical protein QL093DRAFT_2400323 [Fusarium oxysporum]